jgi:hypothetical protein
MAVAGLTLPDMSAFDPPVAGEGSPCGGVPLANREHPRPLSDAVAPGLAQRQSPEVRPPTRSPSGGTR